MIDKNFKKTLFYEQEILLSKIIEANKQLKFSDPQKNIYCTLLNSQLIDLRICYSLCKEQIKFLNDDMTMQIRRFLDKDQEYIEAQHRLNEEEKDSENKHLHNINLDQQTFDKIQVLFKYLFFLFRSIQDSIYAIYLLKFNQTVGSRTSMSDVVSLYFKPQSSNKK